MGVNLNPQDYEENGFEADNEKNSLNQERTDYTNLDESRGDGDENGGRAMPEDESLNKKNAQKLIMVSAVVFLAFGFLILSFLAKGKNQEETQKVQKASLEEVNSDQIKRHQFSQVPPPRIDLGESIASDAIASDIMMNVAASEPTQPNEIIVAQASAPAEPAINPVLERRLGGSVLVNSGSLNETNNTNSENANLNQVSLNEPSGLLNGLNQETNANEKSFNLSGSVFTPRAAQQRGDKTLLLSRGTTIPCVLITKIVTDHAGLTKCQAAKDVWSANGKTVLVERGSIFMGEQTAAMLQGQARVAVRWTQLETPKGVLVDIDSPSVGKLGASGNEAWVNHHFWKRFGGSVMISLIGDLSNGLSKRLSKRQSDITFEESTENAKEMAAEALRNSINIPPTGTINQGTLLNIMVARDVYFGSVYERVTF